FDDRVLHRDEVGRGRLRCLAERPGTYVDPEAGKQPRGLHETQPEAVMEPGSPAFGHWADPRAGCPKGSGGLLAMASLHPLVAVVAAADRNRKARRHRTHLPQVDLELLGQGLELELAAAVRAARREGRFELPVDKPGRCHAVAVATVGLAAAPARLCRFLLRVAFGERGGLALSRTAGLGEQPLQLCDTGITLGKARLTLGQAVVQLPELGGVGLEKPAKLSDLSDQLLVGVGFSARRCDARRNSQQYVQGLLRWWTPLSKYVIWKLLLWLFGDGTGACASSRTLSGILSPLPPHPDLSHWFRRLRS